MTPSALKEIPALIEFLRSANLSEGLVQEFKKTAYENDALNTALTDYFSDKTRANTVPLFIYHEGQNNCIILMADRSTVPPEPGEPGCILSYVRAFGLDETFLHSDCYGQLSCSSCAVEVLAGNPENPTPREEEYDMLDIDEERPPTTFTRLSCQTKIGNDALVIKIRR